MKNIDYGGTTVAQVFAKRLKKLRKENCLKQSELAQQAGISTAYVSKLEQGRAVPSNAILKNLANVLGCDAAWLRSGKLQDVQIVELADCVDTQVEGIDSAKTAVVIQCRQALRDNLQDVNELVAILREADALYDLDSLRSIYQYLHLTVQMADTIVHGKDISTSELQVYRKDHLEQITNLLECCDRKKK